MNDYMGMYVCERVVRTMAKVEQVCTTTPAEVPEGTTDQAVDESAAPNNGGEKTADGSDHPVPGTYFNGTPHVKRPQPAKVFFAPQKYGFFTMNKVEQRWRDDPEKDKKTHADDIIANVTEKFFPGQKRSAESGMPVAPSFLPPPPGVIPPGVPPPPFMIPPTVPARDGKRIKFNDEESDENELFAKLLYKKLNSISSRKRLEILHVSIMEMVRQAQEEDERERNAGIMNPSAQAPLMN
ncbi:hypothetical protein KIN20_009085 [Parelaphostrongylus tenuis]|uniref:Uncharacterized protein n=1 Tax=Parelaphostrongylus tenuis TaxID=148309 RepID=A0AAD5MAN8_PARTN|nr:hypothetical protein KIN20_009085 [Parelaphostrongylus tenuis]